MHFTKKWITVGATEMYIYVWRGRIVGTEIHALLSTSPSRFHKWRCSFLRTRVYFATDAMPYSSNLSRCGSTNYHKVNIIYPVSNMSDFYYTYDHSIYVLLIFALRINAYSGTIWMKGIPFRKSKPALVCFQPPSNIATSETATSFVGLNNKSISRSSSANLSDLQNVMAQKLVESGLPVSLWVLYTLAQIWQNVLDLIRLYLSPQSCWMKILTD